MKLKLTKLKIQITQDFYNNKAKYSLTNLYIDDKNGNQRRKTQRQRLDNSEYCNDRRSINHTRVNLAKCTK